MKEYSSTLGRNGRMTLPAELRRNLGLKPGDRVTVVITDDDTVELRYASESVMGSIPASSTQSDRVERVIETVVEEQAAKSDQRLHEG